MSAAKRRPSSPGGQGEAGPSGKRAKVEDPFSFSTTSEEDIAMLEAVECEEAVDATPSHSTASPLTPSPASQRKAICRPPPPNFDPSMDPVVFQQLDIDHYVSESAQKVGGVSNGAAPVLRMFGVTMDGNSVCAHIHGFLPYFYVLAPVPEILPQHCADLRSSLNDAVLGDARSTRGVLQAVVAVEAVTKSSMYGFHFNKMSTFLKITMALPRLVAPARRLLGTLSLNPFGSVHYQAFESNIDFEIRFMVDADVVGCNWIECPPGLYSLRRPTPSPQSNGYHMSTCPSTGFSTIGSTSPKTKCQIELDIEWEDVVSHAAEGEWEKVAPVRILSFDIECAGRKGVFPEAEHDPVIQIANMVVLQGERDPFVRNVFTLGDCAPIVGSDVRCFKPRQEAGMLQVCC